MVRVVDPKETTRAAAFDAWMNAPNPMVTFFKTLDVTNLVRLSRKKHYKFNMLMDYCIGKAASLIKYDQIAVNTIVKNVTGEVSSCDLLNHEDLERFHKDYLQYTYEVAHTLQDRDLSSECMVIGTSAIIDTELDGVVGMNSGIYNNPFLFWGRYRKSLFKTYLPVSFQFHHTQMDGAHAGRFLEILQCQIKTLK